MEMFRPLHRTWIFVEIRGGKKDFVKEKKKKKIYKKGEESGFSATCNGALQRRKIKMAALF